MLTYLGTIMKREKLSMSRIHEFLENEFDSIEIKSQISGLEETQTIIRDLLKETAHHALTEFLNQANSLVNDLNLQTQESQPHLQRMVMDKVYYAVHFEAIDLNSTDSDFGKTTIYIALGIDLEMQKKVLGYWIKSSSENTYEFWLKVCKELKQSGIQSIHIKSLDNIYWLTKAMNLVFA